MSTDFIPVAGIWDLGHAIKETRKALGGISQERFARRLGTTTRTIARWEASESLSASILSRLRSIALAANAYHAARMFEEKLREDLAWQEGEDFGDSATPGTPEERQLVEELLKRYRAEDPAVQPIVEKLWAFIGEADRERDRDQEPALIKAKEAARKPMIPIEEKDDKK